MRKLIIRLIKFFRPAYWPIVKAYFNFLSPETRGVRVIITHNGEILLIKNSYGLKYNFPGGNLKRQEDPKIGAIREIKEELGIDIGELTFLGNIIPPIEYEYRKNTISIFTAELQTKDLSIRSFEVTNYRWCSPLGLPSVGYVANQVFELYRSSNIVPRKITT